VTGKELLKGSVNVLWFDEETYFIESEIRPVPSEEQNWAWIMVRRQHIEKVIMSITYHEYSSHPTQSQGLQKPHSRGYKGDRECQQFGSMKVDHSHLYFGKQSELGYKETCLLGKHTSYNWRREASLPCWYIILHVQDITSRRSGAWLTDAGLYSRDGVVLGMNDLSREDQKGKEGQESDDVVEEHLGLWLAKVTVWEAWVKRSL
jgi:hypothetical protein